jgi:hypothetical protein
MRTARYYFAYGSNMDEGQMALRCPKAKARGAGKPRRQFIPDK